MLCRHIREVEVELYSFLLSALEVSVQQHSPDVILLERIPIPVVLETVGFRAVG